MGKEEVKAKADCMERRGELDSARVLRTTRSDLGTCVWGVQLCHQVPQEPPSMPIVRY